MRTYKSGHKTTFHKPIPLVDLDNYETDRMNYDINNGHIVFKTFKTIPVEIKAGVFNVVEVSHGTVALREMNFSNKKILSTVSSTEIISEQIDNFCNKFEKYIKRGLVPKRNCLFYSGPGQGKTAAIRTVLMKYLDESTLIINWELSACYPGTFADFIQREIVLSSKIKRVFLLIEDINGVAGLQSDEHTLSSLLNFLCGSQQIFNIPNMVIATTNFPEQLVESIGDRPGRFDVIKQIPNVTPEERVQLVSFYAKDLEGSFMINVDEQVIKDVKYNKLSIAHVEEAVNRSILEDKTIEDTLNEMLEFDNSFKKQFTKKQQLGMGT